VKEGCQKLSGQNKIEMAYWAQLWRDDAVAVVAGRCGDAVLLNTPTRM
jgi:hypothetical protein